MSFLQPSEGKFFVDNVEINSLIETYGNQWLLTSLNQFFLSMVHSENITLSRDLPNKKY